MRSDAAIGRWIGPALTMIGVVATLWLAATGKLTLYIHPRYTVFTVSLALVAGVVVIAAAVVLAAGDGSDAAGDDHPERHPHDHARPSRPRRPPQPRGSPTTTKVKPRPLRGPVRRAERQRLASGAQVLILVCAALALLVVPPATLSARTRQNRELVTSGQALDSADTKALSGGNPATFTVKDWAALLRNGGPDAVLRRPVTVSGYVLDQGEKDVFFAVRLIVSCCAVDAQPIGVPVYRPNWRGELDPGGWIELTGTFAENPDPDSRYPTVIAVDTLTPIDEPDQPYVF